MFEGTERPGNLDSLQAMARNFSNPALHFYPVKGATHFSILAPMTRLHATKILSDDGPASNIALNESELANLVTK